MINSLSIEHWHYIPSPNGIEVIFYTKTADGQYHARPHRHLTKTSLNRLMMLVCHKTIAGWWVMTPYPVGSRNHWSYCVQQAEEKKNDD